MDAQLLPNPLKDEYSFGYLPEYDSLESFLANTDSIRSSIIPSLPPDLADSSHEGTLKNYIGTITQQNYSSPDYQTTKEMILYGCLNNAQNPDIRLLAQEKLAALYQESPHSHRGLAKLLYEVHITKSESALLQLTNAYRYAELGLRHNLEAAIQTLSLQHPLSDEAQTLYSHLQLLLFKTRSLDPLEGIDSMLESNPVFATELLFHITFTPTLGTPTRLAAVEKLSTIPSPHTLNALLGLIYDAYLNEQDCMYAASLLARTYPDAAPTIYQDFIRDDTLSEKHRKEALKYILENRPSLAPSCCQTLLESESISADEKLTITEILIQLEAYGPSLSKTVSKSLTEITQNKTLDADLRIRAAHIYYRFYDPYFKEGSPCLLLIGLLGSGDISSTHAIDIATNYIYPYACEIDKAEADLCLQQRAMDIELNAQKRIELALTIFQNNQALSVQILMGFIKDTSLSIENRKLSATSYLDTLNHSPSALEALAGLTQIPVTPDTVESARQIHEIASSVLVNYYNNLLNPQVYYDYSDDDSDDEDLNEAQVAFLLNKTGEYLTILTATNIEDNPIQNPYFQYQILLEKSSQSLKDNPPSIEVGGHTLSLNFNRFGVERPLPPIPPASTFGDWLSLVKGIFLEATSSGKEDVLKEILTTLPQIKDEQAPINNDNEDFLSNIKLVLDEDEKDNEEENLFNAFPQHLSEDLLLSIARSDYFKHLLLIPLDAIPPNRYALILQNLLHIAKHPTPETEIKEGILSHQSQLVLQILLNVLSCPTGKDDGLVQLESLALKGTCFIPEDEKAYWENLKQQEEQSILAEQKAKKRSMKEASQAYTHTQTKYRYIEEALIEIESIIKDLTHKLIYSQSTFLKTLTETPENTPISERQHCSRWVRYLLGNELGLLMPGEVPSFDRSTGVIPQNLLELDKFSAMFFFTRHLFESFKQVINERLQDKNTQDSFFQKISALLNYKQDFFDENLIDENRLIYTYTLNDLGLIELLQKSRWISIL